MDPSLERVTLISEFHSFSRILTDRGLDYVEKTSEELDVMKLSDLRSLVHTMRDVARTPQ